MRTKSTKDAKKYTRKSDKGLGDFYIFIQPYMDIMTEAEKITGKSRWFWMHDFNTFIFDGREPALKSSDEKFCWEKLINELDSYTFKKGKYSPRWKGGITDENHIVRASKEYKEWRLKVFTRDGFTCQICKKVGGELNAHHIKRFAKDKENRFNVANGITLCAKCHRMVHKTEGR